MNGPSKVSKRTALAKLWHRWTTVVEQFATQKRGRHRLSGPAYSALHQDLLQTCRCLADTADKQGRGIYKNLESLAQPWMSPIALAKADLEVLSDLLRRCRQAERELAGRTGTRLVGIFAWLGLALAATIFWFVLLNGFGNGGWASLRKQVNQELRALRFALSSSDTTWIWIGGSGVLALLAAWLVMRAIRA
jgi:hypothetical protein